MIVEIDQDCNDQSKNVISETGFISLIRTGVAATSRCTVLASLGTMEAQFGAPLKPLEHHKHYGIEGFKGSLNWAPMMPRGASLPKDCTPARCSNSSPN